MSLEDKEVLKVEREGERKREREKRREKKEVKGKGEREKRVRERTTVHPTMRESEVDKEARTIKPVDK